MSSLQVEIKGLDKLMAKLGNVEKPIRPLLEKAAKFALAQAQVFAKPHPADKGTLAKGLKFELAAGAVTLHARVFPVAAIVGIANVVEEGRKPGKQPPYQALVPFVQSHGVTMGPATGEKAIAYLMAVGIKHKGTKGVRFMAKAADATDKKLPGLVAETVKEMEKDWRA
jgi:hypothetical protein